MKKQSRHRSAAQETPGREKERELVSNWKQNKKNAFNKLWMYFNQWVLKITLRMVGNAIDADDVTQEVFLKIYRFSHRFKEGTNFRAWVYRIASNTAMTMARVKSTQKTKGEEYDERYHQERLYATYSIGTDPLTAFENRDCGEEIEFELAKLLPERRELIRLCEFEGYSYAEAAQQTNTKIGTIMSRLYRAKRDLRELLIKKLDEYPDYVD